MNFVSGTKKASEIISYTIQQLTTISKNLTENFQENLYETFNLLHESKKEIQEIIEEENDEPSG